MIIGIDPGPTQSAYAIVNPDYSIYAAARVENRHLLNSLQTFLADNDTMKTVVIESIQSYGAPVGRETFETCYQIGAFRYIAEQSIWANCVLIPRQEYVNAICGCRGTDAVLRQALLLRFGGDKKGEPLNALKGSTDLRSAYAVAVYHMDKAKWTATAPTERPRMAAQGR